MPLPSLWLKGEMEGNPAGVFTCTASTHGGQQTTLVTMMIPLPHLGTLIVGVPYSVEGMLHTEATPHGATTIAGGQGELEPRPENLVIARKQLRLNLTPPGQISTLPAVLVNLEPRPNAARTFFAALKDDWKLPNASVFSHRSPNPHARNDRQRSAMKNWQRCERRVGRCSIS